MTAREFIKFASNQLENGNVKKITIQTKDTIYRWTENRTFVTPIISPPNLGTAHRIE